LLLLGEVNKVCPIGLKNRPQHQNPWSAVDLNRADSAQPSPSLSPNAPRNSKSVKRKEKRRNVVLYFVLALAFVRFSMIHQILESFLHTDTFILYVVAIPVIVRILSTPAFKRSFQYRPAWFWAAFALWMIPASVFSTWKSGSFALMAGYYRTELVLLFAFAGLITTWSDCRRLLYTISAATLVNVVSFLLLRQVDSDGRLSLTFGTVANSNDYSGHLIFVMPFLLWFILVARSTFLRICGFLALALGLYEILAAGSRGSMLGLVTALIVFTITTSPKVRRIVLVTAPALAVLVLALLPGSVVHRIFLFSADNSDISAGAMESSHDREQLLKDAIMTTIHHPLFGVGPGQFSNVEGKQTAHSQQRLWLGTHNSFMQVASENGVPALIFYLGGIVSSLLLLNRTGAFLKRRPALKDAAAAVVCLRIGLISFCVTIFFLNFGYFFYLPALAGITIAVTASVKRQVRESLAAQQEKPSPEPAAPVPSSDWGSPAPASS
jgi:O-antigen ligase